MNDEKKTVVIFEDNPSVRLLLKHFFQKRGYAAEAYDDGADAVARVRSRAPVLIVTDNLMPARSGIDVCADLRREGFSAPIVMLTSESRDLDRRRALEAGANAYLLKPFDAAALDDALKPLLAA